MVRKITAKKEDIEIWIQEGKTATEIAKIFGVTKSAMCQHIKKIGIKIKNGRPVGIPMSVKQKELFKIIFSGSANPFYNKKHSDETKKKMKGNRLEYCKNNGYLHFVLTNNDVEYIEKMLIALHENKCVV